MAHVSPVDQQDFVFLIQTRDKSLKKKLSQSVTGEKVRLVSIDRSDVIEGRQEGGQIVALIIGSDVEDPVRSAQRLHSSEKNAKIILLAKSRKNAEVYKQTIRFSPFLGSNVSCLEESEVDKLVSMLRNSLKAGKYKAIIKETNLQISSLDISRRQAFHQQFINKLMDIAPIGIAIVSRAGEVLGWNREAAAIFGKNEADVLGSPLGSLFTGAQRRKLEQYIARSFRTSAESHPEDSLELQRETAGDSGQVLTCSTARFNNTGDAEEEVMILTIKDITEQKVAETRLREANKALARQAKELAASNAELEQFAFVASHDLQEPLRMITGFLSRLEKKYNSVLDEKGKKYIHFATDGAKRMRQTILDLLEFSRVGSVDIDREEVDLNQLLEDVLSLNKKLITESKANIKIEELPVIFAAESMMHQLFQNLLINAVKYQKKGEKPYVTVSFREEKKHWLFMVRDNGIGIKEEYSEKIFNIFQRLHVKEEYSGTGMGLAICKKIVESHGGEIWVESEVGKGSIFYFTLKKMPVDKKE